MKDELFYKDYMGKVKIIHHLIRDNYDIPPHLPKKWPHEWEEAQVEPLPLVLTDEQRFDGTHYWDYIAIAYKYHEEYGVWLNRAEIQLLIKAQSRQARTEKIKNLRAEKLLENSDEIIRHLQQAKLLPQDEASDYIATHLKWLC